MKSCINQQSVNGNVTRYNEFLKGKIDIAEWTGFPVYDLHPDNFPHQNDAIKWAAMAGRGLIAMSFGLGKTVIQVELARLIHRHTAGKFMVVCPLGVKHQFSEEDGPRLGIKFQYVTSDKEVELSDTPYLITNYERIRDGNIDPRRHNITGCSLDEGSTLRNLGSKTYQIFNEVFANVKYPYVATATPSPNNYRELINYADFLQIMDRGQALTRFFQRDVNKAGNLTLHPQHERDFWLWVASWALFVYRPSDLGHSDEGYELPELRVHWHRQPVDHRRAWTQTDNRGQGRLILNAANGVREAVAEKRATIDNRIEKAVELIKEYPINHWLIWYHLEDERRAVEQAIPQSKSVYGSQDLDLRESRIIDFTRGKIPILDTKPEIAGSGCNFQRWCHDAIFLGVDYRFQDFIQAVHRIYRFQQEYPVNIHIIYAESEDDIITTLKRKWEQHDILTKKMQDIVKKYGLVHEALKNNLTRQIGVARQEVSGQLFTAILNDTVIETSAMATNSIDLIHTSIPFGNHYEYTVQYEDFGHNPSDNNFWQQMEFLTPELLRVLKPGRVCAVHVKDRVLYGHQTPHGFMEIAPFSDECVMHFRRHGWMYEGRRTIVTDVVRENNSTYRLGWTEMSKDATKMGSGLPEYILLFRKPPTDNKDQRADEPVIKDKADYSRARWQVTAHGFWRSSGNRPLSPDEIKWYRQTYDFEGHVARLQEREDFGNLPTSFFYEPPISPIAWEMSPVWDDVQFMRGLNADQSRKRLENHICPLPFDIVERIIKLYSNENDLVYDPFAGLFTVPYVAIKMRRRAIGTELHPPYFAYGVKYCQDAEEKALTPTLFDWLQATQEKPGILELEELVLA